MRNGIKLYYPVIESILSILPICDEFIIAMGKGDAVTMKQGNAFWQVNEPKIKIIDTEWEPKLCQRGVINA